LLCFAFVATLTRVLSAETGNGGLIAPELVQIPAGTFIIGSDKAERDYAYQLDEIAYGHDFTRVNKWYENENASRSVFQAAFSITWAPITNQQYAAYINETAGTAPSVTEDQWESYGLIHPYSRALKYSWKNSTPPKNRNNHPVVLISHEDASRYAKWLSKKTGKTWQLPTEQQWEKAARGTDGRYFPWGNIYSGAHLNSHDLGPFDTVPVGRFHLGLSPYGAADLSGQVFEWTRKINNAHRVIVKGGSWDDKGCGVCRAAARHSRPANLKHILIGFRLVIEGT
ncbi:MAG: SUMF1/EgtB/PvdO family nonheme iron enzyme, partial [Sneathiella sp.]|nr:SUMF1/EgtB/PvdO family nonheme iron enzyme [Sneathiella sp.]